MISKEQGVTQSLALLHRDLLKVVNNQEILLWGKLHIISNGLLKKKKKTDTPVIWNLVNTNFIVSFKVKTAVSGLVKEEIKFPPLISIQLPSMSWSGEG